jgi:outer membrane murein-binding lipoprotein Lpp
MKMSQNITPHKKKEFVSKPLKFIIAAASVAGTLGLWGIFSKADVQATAVQGSNASFPTLATLVSVNANSVTNSSTNNAAANDSVSSLPAVTQPPTVSSYSAPVVTYNQPSPITSTRSSRP